MFYIPDVSVVDLFYERTPQMINMHSFSKKTCRVFTVLNCRLAVIFVGILSYSLPYAILESEH